MIPTVEGIFVGVREALADVEEPGGGTLTNERLLEFYKRSYEKMFAGLMNMGLSSVRKTVYWNLPLKTAIITPAQLEIQDFGEPRFIWERGNLTSAAVTAASATTPIVLTSTGHPFADYDLLIVSQVGPESNGRWFIQLDGGDPANKFNLRGSSSATSRSPSNGKASKSSEQFTLMEAVDSLSQRDPSERLLEYVWEEEAIHLIGSTQERQLKIEYLASGSPPLTGTVGLDGCSNFLTAYTAALAGAAYDRVTRARELMGDAVGAGDGGYLDEFLRGYVKSMQRQPWRPKSRLLPFRRPTHRR